MFIALKRQYKVEFQNQAFMSSSFLSEKQLGIIPKNTIISLDGVLGVDETFEYYFSVGGDEGYFTEITLNNLRDDLDILTASVVQHRSSASSSGMAMRMSMNRSRNNAPRRRSCRS